MCCGAAYQAANAGNEQCDDDEYVWDGKDDDDDDGSDDDDGGDDDGCDEDKVSASIFDVLRTCTSNLPARMGSAMTTNTLKWAKMVIALRLRLRLR